MISFEREILESLSNNDMLISYVKAAIANKGAGVRVNGALWPHLTPPAKVGGVARALVKMGLLVPAGAGLYLVVTGKANLERVTSDKQAKCQRQASEVPAFATEPLQDVGSDVSEGQAEPERHTSTNEAADQQLSNAEQGMRDIDALESLLDNMATKEAVVQTEDSEAFIDISDPDESQPAAPTMGLGLRRSAVSTAATPPDDEARAREMALEAWEVADARTFQTCEGEFEQFWMYRKRHFMDQARQKLAAS